MGDSRRTIGLLIAVVSALVVACGDGRGEVAETAPFPRAPIVLISIDTLRADRLPAYGYRGVETPAIDALRRDAVLAERAYSPYPLTLPAHATILTGLLPPAHGVRDNLGYRLDTDQVPFLPLELGAVGYFTGGFVSSFVLNADTGLGTGFDVYDDAVEGVGENATALEGIGQRAGGETAERAIAWLDSLDTGAPFFLFVHLYEPHSPYRAPEPFASRFSDPYDAEIAAADAIVGSILAALRTRGVYQKAIVVLVSDHGEGLGDHGELEHGILLHREALEVPLIVKLPEGSHAGASLPVPVQLADLAPSLRAWVGLPKRSRKDGPRQTILDLGADGAPQRVIYAETLYPRLQLGWSDLGSIIEGRWHFIAGPRPALYDLVADPAERIDRLSGHRRLAHRLSTAFEDRTEPPEMPAEADEETRRTLSALGYVASSSARIEGPLPDPHEVVSKLRVLRDAERRAAHGQIDAALASVDDVLAEQAQMPMAWLYRARILESVGRLQEAHAAYKRAIQQAPQNPRATLGAASLSLRLGRLYEAAGWARQAQTAHPWLANALLAEILLASGDVEAAAEHAERAVMQRPMGAAPRVTLALIALRLGQLTVAQHHLDSACALSMSSTLAPSIAFATAEVLAAEERWQEAEAHYRQAIEGAPRDPAAYRRLARLLVYRGRYADSLEALNRLVAANPYPWAYAAGIETLESLGNPSQAAALRRQARERFGDLPVFIAAKPLGIAVGVE